MLSNAVIWQNLKYFCKVFIYHNTKVKCGQEATYNKLCL
jgi:hypothetical protein